MNAEPDGGLSLIAAIVRYRLPPTIDREDCRKHFHGIAPDFVGVPGLLSKQFICAEDGVIAGGIYQWASREAALSFYNGPWRTGIIARYGMEPEIELFDVFGLTDNTNGTIDRF
jgi:hypothetical protein